MLTSRGWWLLVGVLAVTAYGLLGPPDHNTRSVALLGLTLGLWFAWEWFWFALRVRLALPRLQVRRQLRDARGPVDTLWAGRSFEVRAELELSEGVPGLPYASV